MSKHLNIHWIREKELKSLVMEYRFITKYKYANFRMKTTRESEMERILTYRFYNQFYNWYSVAPKFYRKMKNRRSRHNSKSTLHNILKFGKNFEFEDNYKDANWFW